MVTIDDIDKQIEKRVYTPPQPPEPATSVSPPTSRDAGFGQLREAITLLAELEKWRQTIVQTEILKIQASEDTIKKRVDQAIANMPREGNGLADQLFLEGGREFITMMKQARMSSAWQERPAANRANSSPSTAQTAQTTPQAQNAQPTEAEEVAGMKLSRERAQYFADMIFEHFPEKVLAAQRGEISKEEALQNIMAGGANKENAELIYTELMNTDYSGQDDKATQMTNEHSTTQGMKK